MGIIKNLIETKFTSLGANKVAADIEHLDRSQTRLGQSSASAGRQFAAQSQGLGGLVGAYAGAAATTFALEAAFTALNRAAQIENIIRGTNALAASVGSNGPKILNSIKAITNGQLTLAEAAQSANIALSAGFSTEQIDRLTVAAMKTSRALGRDLTDSLTRLVRGTAKLEPELLDELGIFVRIEAATKRYAQQNNLSANSLSDFQRRQAFLNAALDEADRKFSVINTSAPSAQQSFERLAATIRDLATVLGNLLNTVLKPAADFFANDLGNSVVLFGTILLLVFAKAKTLATDFVTSTTGKITKWADDHVTAAEKVRNSYAGLAKAEADFAKQVVERKGLLPKTVDANGVPTVDRTGSFSQQGVPKSIAMRLADFRQQFKSQGFSKLGFDELKSLSKRLDDDLNQIGDRLQGVAKQDAVAMQTALSTALTQTTAKTKLLTGSMVLLKNSLSLIGTIASGLLSAFNWVFLVASVAELLGFDVFGTIIGWFKKTQKEADSFRAGLVGAFTDAAGGAQKLTDTLRAAGATQEDIDNIGQKMVSTYSSLKETANQNRIEFAKLSAVRKSLFLDTPTEDPLVTTLAVANKELETLKGKDVTLLSSEEYQRLLVLESIIKTLQTIPEGSLSLLGGVSVAGGLDAAKVFASLKKDVTETVDLAGNAGIKLRGIFIKYGTDGSAYLSDQSEELQSIFIKLGTSATTLDEMNSAFLAGTASAQAMGAQIAGVEESLKITNKESSAVVQNFIEQGMSLDQAVAQSQALLDIEKEKLATEKDRYKFILALNNIQKGIETAFGKEMRSLDTMQYEGLISLSGQFAKNEIDIARNKNDILKYSLQTLQIDESRLQYLNTATELTLEEQNEKAKLIYQQEAYTAAVKATAGTYVQLIQSVNDFAIKSDEMIADIKQQIASIQTDEFIANIKFNVDMLALDMQAAQAARQFEIAFRENQIKISQLQVDTGQKTQLEGINDQARLEKEILDQRRLLLIEERALASLANVEDKALLAAKLEQEKSRIKLEVEATRQKIKAEYDLLKATAELFSSVSTQLETALVSGGNSIGQAIVGAINAATSSFVASLGDAGAELGVSAKAASFTPVAMPAAREIALPSGGTISELELSLGKLDGAFNSTNEALSDLESAQIAYAENSTQREAELLDKKYKMQQEDFERQAALLTQQGDLAALEDLKRRQELAKAGGGGGGKDAKAELTEIQKMLTELFDSIKSNISNALMSLNDLIFYGEGNFGDIMGNLFKSIQQDLFKTTIADPLSDTLTEGIFSIFGIKGGKKGIENARVVNGALQVQVVSGPEELFGGLFKSKDEEQQDPTGGAFSGFFDKIGGFFANLFGSDGIISRLFSGLFGQGGILSGLFGGILSLFGFGTAAAQGGLMHLAQGGAAISSTMRRDRIPAMLEPGEFVLRKQAVKSVGVPALQAMNASGKSTNVAPIINITNEGSPKDVQTAQPRFDGEKYVIDIVMRDFNNNGPIRRSLRAKGGL